MTIGSAMKKGMEIASKSLLLCLVAVVVLFVGYLIVGFVLGGAILTSNFPPITPDMTADQINALDWSGVKWGIFVPAALVAFLLGFLLNSFTQGGIIATLRDCIKEGKERIGGFFKNALKYMLPLLGQMLLIILITILVVAAGLIVMALIAAIRVAAIVIVADVLIFVILLGLLLYIAMLLMYGQISLVVNNSGAIKALGQSLAFLKKNLVKALVLFILTGLIYIVIYIILQFLTRLTFTWPVASRIIWSLITSYLYIVVSVFMIGSFLSFYLATDSK